MKFKEAYEKLRKDTADTLSSIVFVRVGRQEFNKAMAAVKTMANIEDEMERIAQEGYEDVEKYNALKWVLDQCREESWIEIDKK